VEDVFINETEEIEIIASDLIKNDTDIEEFLTIMDISMQQQAWLTEQICLEMGQGNNPKKGEQIVDVISKIWEDNYLLSLNSMKEVVDSSNTIISNLIIDIALNICKSRIDAAESINKDVTEVLNQYESAKKQIEESDFQSGFKSIIKTFNQTNSIISGKSIVEGVDDKTKEIGTDILFLTISLILVIILIFIFIIKRKN